MSGKKIIYAEDLLLAVRDDPSINGANFARVKRHLEEAKVVDAVEVVHGRWKFNRGSAPNEKSYFCSVCTDGESDYGNDNYCPNCGALMDGDGNG